MKIDEIVAKVAATAGMKPGVLMKAVDEMFAAVRLAVQQGEKVSIPGTGAFYLRSREAGEKVSPKTGEKHAVEASSFMAFKPLNNATGRKKNKEKKEKKEKK